MLGFFMITMSTNIIVDYKLKCLLRKYRPRAVPVSLPPEHALESFRTSQTYPYIPPSSTIQLNTSEPVGKSRPVDNGGLNISDLLPVDDE